MPKYIALRETLISHECRIVKEGEEFETTFPEGMKLSDNLKLVKAPARTVKTAVKTTVKGSEDDQNPDDGQDDDQNPEGGE
jgi:hypothetical protein